MRTHHLLASSLLLLAVSGAALADGAGTLVRYQGPVEIRGKAQARPAAEAMTVNAGDSVVTGERGQAQLRLEDDSIFVVPANSELKIDDFRLGKERRAAYTLERGGVRTITGQVGKRKGDRYELRTAQAKLTVQGTAYSALICDGNCGNGMRKGTYVRDEAGSVTVTNDGGKLKLRPGDVAYVESRAVAPVKVTLSPFEDPAIAAAFEVDVDVKVDVHPPRIENDPPASPS